MKIDYYKLYQYNIWTLINEYKLEYHWWNIHDIEWCTDKEAYNFSISKNNDPWVFKYQEDCKQLGYDMLNNGTFTPLFYKEQNNKIYISIGRHRAYALSLIPHDKKFLFIKINDNFYRGTNSQKKLYYFGEKGIYPKKYFVLYDILSEPGNFLTHYLWENKITPAPQFNNEKLFEEWLETPQFNNEKLFESLSHIKRIDIEFQSYCNRICEWCPNKKFDRTLNKILNPQTSLLPLLDDLKEAKYNGHFSLTGYQEIFSNPSLAQIFINEIHNFFPNAHITGASNGDFINKFALKNIGLNYLMIEDYDCKGPEYWKNKCYEFNIKMKYFDNTLIIGEHPNIQTVFIKLNWPKTVQLENRGGFFEPKDLPGYLWKNNMEPRTIPCAEPTYYLNISYDGSVMPCCHMRPDNPNHKEYILGNINEQSIIDIYYSEKAQRFREQVRMRDNNKLPEPCKRCHKYRDGKITGSPDGWDYKGLEYYKQNLKEI